MKKTKRAAFLCIGIGCFLLVLGIIAAFTMGTLFVPIAIFASILLNSAGIVLLRHQGGDDTE